jgi:hypothetical protein
MDIVEESAAMMLLGAWRAKVARRRMLLKKAEKQRLLEDGYARKIQSRYRSRLAARKVARLKAEKLALKQRIAAMKVQSRWRIFVARNLVQMKQSKKMEEEYAKSVNRTRGVIRLQQVIRAFIARKKFAKGQIFHPSVLQVNVHKVEGLTTASGNETAEIGAICSGLILDVPLDSSILFYSRSSIPEDLVRHRSFVTSNYNIMNITNHNDTALVTSPRRMDYVVITLYERTAHTKDDFLGQVTTQ